MSFIRLKGSAYRCLKTGDPIDSVVARAARESGVPISDILENLPNELSVWVDPGEVSYRIGEKGAVKVSDHIVGFAIDIVSKTIDSRQGNCKSIDTTIVRL